MRKRRRPSSRKSTISSEHRWLPPQQRRDPPTLPWMHPPLPPPPPTPSVWGPSVSRNKNWEVRYHLDGLKHYMLQHLSPLYILFPIAWTERALEVRYTIGCGNHPDGFHGKFTILVDRSS